MQKLYIINSASEIRSAAKAERENWFWLIVVQGTLLDDCITGACEDIENRKSGTACRKPVYRIKRETGLVL